MPPSLENLARSLGLVNPQVKQFSLKIGSWFTITGTLPNRVNFKIRYELVRLDSIEVTFKMDGADSSGGRFESNFYGMKLRPNMLQRLDTPYGEVLRLWIAFVTHSPAKFGPKPGESVDIAYGVRDTVPPPPPKG